MGQNYYEILGVGQKAALKEIRTAYIVKIRQYPAEFHPEMFRLVQEAYDVLSDETKRAHYNIEFIHGEEINEYFDIAYEAYEKGEYDEAQNYFSKVLSINPKDAKVLNYYALSMLHSGLIEEAITELKNVIQLESENVTYYSNLAFAYERNKDYQSAIRYYKQALIRKPTDFEIVDRLSFLYYDIDDFESAWNIVERTMKKHQMNGQVKFLYMKLLLQLSILQDAKFEMKIAFKYLQKFLEEVPSEKDFALMNLYDLCVDFAKAKNYKGAKTLIDWLVTADDEDADFIKLQRSIHRDFALFGEFDELVYDESIINEIRYKAYLYLFSDEVEDFEEETKLANDNIIAACENDRVNVKNSVERLKRHYPTIYEELSSWFNVVESYL